MNPGEERLQKFEEFLADTSNESKKDILRELRLLGVDTNAFMHRLNQVVAESYSKKLQELATSKRGQCIPPSFLTQLSCMQRKAMLKIFERIRNGEFGGSYQEAAIARCRNSEASELSDTELRSWLEDIGDSLGEPD